MVVHSVKHIFMRNITSYERKERIIFIIYLDKIPPKGNRKVYHLHKNEFHDLNTGQMLVETESTTVNKVAIKKFLIAILNLLHTL